MKKRDIARAGLTGAIICGCAFSLQAATTDNPEVYDASVSNGITADIVTAGLGAGLLADTVINRPSRRPTVRRKPRTRKS